MKKKAFLFFLTVCMLTSCFDRESDKSKMAQAEKECFQKTQIENLTISFFGYEADSIEVKIKRNQKIIDQFTDKIPEKIEDSLRHLRCYTVDRKILLTDTLLLKINSEPEKKVYDFKYMVHPQFSMFTRNWRCVFYQLTIDGKTQDGGRVNIMKAR